MIVLLLTLCLGLCGCAEAQQVENQAFVIALGLDAGEDGSLELTAQVPRIEGKSGDEGGEGESSYMIFTTRGKGFTEALELLTITVPRRVNLTQVKMIVISEALATQSRFQQILQEMAETYHLYSTAYFAICQNRTDTFLSQQEPLLSGSLTASLTAFLKHHDSHGYSSATTFADVYYLSNSVYSDPIAILAATALDEENSADDAPASMYPDELPVKSESKNEYAGGAILKKGILAEKLNAREMIFANLIRGRKNEIVYSYNGFGMKLFPDGKPDITINVKDPVTRIRFRQKILVAPLTEMPPADEIRQALSDEIFAVVQKCQRAQVEPFGFSEKAAAQFLTLEDWARYGWREHFTTADIRIEIEIEQAEV